MQFRQGDVFIQKIDSIPKDANPTNDPVLAYGEVTGHKHVLQGKTVQLFEKNGTKYARVQKAQVVHDEHKAIDLPDGNYAISIQREYSPLANRQVMD